MLNLSIQSLFFLFFLHCTRIEEFAKEEIDLTLATRLEFDTPLADMSDVRTMMDSINVVPGLIYNPLPQFTHQASVSDSQYSTQMKVHFLVSICSLLFDMLCS